MMRLVSDGIWTELRRLAKKNRPVLAAVAYVTSNEYLRFGEGDTLVCDATDDAIKFGRTSAAVLREAYERGARLFSSPGLHAKALLLGRTAVVGSANLSMASATKLNEAALFTDDVRAVSAVRVLIEELLEEADEINEHFLQRIEALRVKRVPRGSQRRHPVRMPVQRAWLVSVVPLADDKHADETAMVQEEQSKAERETEYSDSEPGYLRFIGVSKFRKFARKSDIVIAIWRSHFRASRAYVFAPEPVLRRKDRNGVTHFFIEEYANREDTKIPWTAFCRLWRKTTSNRPPGLRTIREVPVELLEQLRAAWPK